MNILSTVSCNCRDRVESNSVNRVCMGASVPPCIVVQNNYQVKFCLFKIKIRTELRIAINVCMYASALYPM